MSITPPEDGTPGTTPLYDETIAAPPYEELRVPGGIDDGAHDDPSAKDQAKERAKQTAGTAKDAAAGVASGAKDAAGSVAATGKEQAGKVAKDALGQARDLYGQATEQLSEQAGTQQQKAAGTLHTFADDLAGMRGDQQGLAAELLENVGDRAKGVAQWLEDREPGEVLAEVKRFAANRPWVFIGLAAGAGLLAGRLTKALVAEAKDDAEPTAADTAATSSTSTYDAGIPGYDAPAASYDPASSYDPAVPGSTALGGVR
ncbi:hypothetical protein [uncultured Amnibacterium sp.]|uniref:hypothetical protein n=1 Tax=uncultured Amnibacterium sp. TaxID=1631851 RepID=UPI0035CB03D2